MKRFLVLLIACNFINNVHSQVKIYDSEHIINFPRESFSNISTKEVTSPNLPIKLSRSDIILKNNSSYLLAPDGGETKISFVGNGDIQKSITQNSGVQANTGLGIIFFRSWSDNAKSGRSRTFKNIELDFVINIASTADSIIVQRTNSLITNKRQFGNYILNPINSKQATFFNFSSYFNNNTDWGTNGKFNWFRNLISGINFRFVASNATWTNQQTVNLSGFALRGGIFHEFVPDKIRMEKDYSVLVGVNYTYRGILGDIRFKENEEFRKSLLGTSRVKFHGLEFTAGLKFQNIRAEVQIPMIKYRNDEVLGLTNTQLITSIRFVGGFPLQLKNNDNNSNNNTSVP